MVTSVLWKIIEPLSKGFPSSLPGRHFRQDQGIFYYRGGGAELIRAGWRFVFVGCEYSFSTCAALWVIHPSFLEAVLRHVDIADGPTKRNVFSERIYRTSSSEGWDDASPARFRGISLKPRDVTRGAVRFTGKDRQISRYSGRQMGLLVL
jgi:hypothetical protein